MMTSTSEAHLSCTWTFLSRKTQFTGMRQMMQPSFLCLYLVYSDTNIQEGVRLHFTLYMVLSCTLQYLSISVSHLPINVFLLRNYYNHHVINPYPLPLTQRLDFKTISWNIIFSHDQSKRYVFASLCRCKHQNFINLIDIEKI